MDFYNESNDLVLESKSKYIYYKKSSEVKNYNDYNLCLKNHYYRSIIVLESKSTIKNLKSKIFQNLDKFPKLIGLNHISIKSISYKKDNTEFFLDMKSNDLLENYINFGDTIYFELSFKEIWIKVNYKIKINSKSKFLHAVNERKSTHGLENYDIYNGLKFSFNLKIETLKSLYDLGCMLIIIGFKNFITLNKENRKNDYFIFKTFKMENEKDKDNEESNNRIEQYQNSFLEKFILENNYKNDFQTKIKKTNEEILHINFNTDHTKFKENEKNNSPNNLHSSRNSKQNSKNDKNIVKNNEFTKKYKYFNLLDYITFHDFKFLLDNHNYNINKPDLTKSMSDEECLEVFLQYKKLMMEKLKSSVLESIINFDSSINCYLELDSISGIYNDIFKCLNLDSHNLKEKYYEIILYNSKKIILTSSKIIKNK